MEKVYAPNSPEAHRVKSEVITYSSPDPFCGKAKYCTFLCFPMEVRTRLSNSVQGTHQTVVCWNNGYAFEYTDELTDIIFTQRGTLTLLNVSDAIKTSVSFSKVKFVHSFRARRLRLFTQLSADDGSFLRTLLTPFYSSGPSV